MLTTTSIADALISRQGPGPALDTLWLQASEDGQAMVKAAPSEHLAIATLTKGASAEVTEAIARLTTSPLVLAHLVAKDKRKTVRRAVASNQATSPDLLVQLLKSATRKTTWHEPTQIALIKRPEVSWATVVETYKSNRANLDKEVADALVLRAWAEGSSALWEVLSWDDATLRSEVVEQLSRGWRGEPPIPVDEVLASFSPEEQWRAVQRIYGSRRGALGTISHDFVVRASQLYPNLSPQLQDIVERHFKGYKAAPETVDYLLATSLGFGKVRDYLLATSASTPADALSRILSGNDDESKAFVAARVDLSEELVLEALDDRSLLGRIISRNVELSAEAADKVLDTVLVEENPPVSHVLACTSNGDAAKRLKLVREHGSWRMTQSWMKASTNGAALVRDLVELVADPGQAFASNSRISLSHPAPFEDPYHVLLLHDSLEVLKAKGVRDNFLDTLPGVLKTLRSASGVVFERLVANLGDRIYDSEGIDLAIGLAPTWSGSIRDFVDAVDLSRHRP